MLIDFKMHLALFSGKGFLLPRLPPQSWNNLIQLSLKITECLNYLKLNSLRSERYLQNEVSLDLGTLEKGKALSIQYDNKNADYGLHYPRDTSNISNIVLFNYQKLCIHTFILYYAYR